MNSFFDLAKTRYSCRMYSDKPIPKQHIESIFESVRVAPSAKNLQPWRFVVITQSPLREQIVACYKSSWLNSAPVIIVACADHSIAWQRADGKNHCDIDLAIAIDHLTLAATDNGLATCWICRFDTLKCAELLKLPGRVSPVAIIPLGYPEKENNFAEIHLVRKPLDEIIGWEGYNF